MWSGYVVSVVYGIVVKALLAKGPVWESSKAWLAASMLLYTPALAVLWKGADACCCQPGWVGPVKASAWVWGGCSSSTCCQLGVPIRVRVCVGERLALLVCKAVLRPGCSVLEDGRCYTWELALQAMPASAHDAQRAGVDSWEALMRPKPPMARGRCNSCQRVYWQRVCLQKLREAAADVKVVLFCKGGCLRRR